jgi:drug/metabolite transporter (DMT)-like permease
MGRSIATDNLRLGVALIAGSALLWSVGGTIARFIDVQDSWTIVFWRSLFASGFLVIFLALRDGAEATISSFTGMGLPGLLVALCFGIASTSFVVALSYTTVANILLIQAGVPLLAALLGFVLFRERPTITTWIAIAFVIVGVGVMVSNSLTGKVSPIGDGLALVIALVFAIATVTTRRFRSIRMVPANALAVTGAATVAAFMAKDLVVSWSDLLWLIAFGAINLGAGLALFAYGTRMVPATVAALVGTIEPVLAPLWVWLVHGEVPDNRTLLGGGIVFAALLAHLVLEFRRSRQAM